MDLTLRVRALESLLAEKGLVDPAGLGAPIDAHKSKVGARAGARVAEHAGVDPAYKRRLSSFKAAAVHAASVYLNREATLNKTCDFIHEAARQGAQFIAFPESFLPVSRFGRLCGPQLRITHSFARWLQTRFL